MKWGSKGVILISVKMIAKVIRIHAILVLGLLFFSFIQIDFGHAVLYYIAFFLNFPPVHFKATYSHPIEMNSELTIGSKIIWSLIWIIFAKTYYFEAVDYQKFWALK